MYEVMLLKLDNDRGIGAYYAGLCQVFLKVYNVATDIAEDYSETHPRSQRYGLPLRVP